MTITPFLTQVLRGKRDALLARQKARRVANLLNYDPHEQACIAAGVFLVACQALARFGKARLFFQIDNHQLQVFARNLRNLSASEMNEPSANRLAEIFREEDSHKLFHFTKPLPHTTKDLHELDIGWLVNMVEETVSSGVFEEIVKQNQEILALLHELRSYRVSVLEKEGKTQNPHAA
jgi:hypothetical protein